MSVAVLTLAAVISLLIFGRQYIAAKVSALLFLVKKEPLLDSQRFKLPLTLPGSNSEPAKSGAYRLGGIIYDLEFPVVIINGKSLKKGDLIEGYRVDEISESSAELVSLEDQTRLILSLDF